MVSVVTCTLRLNRAIKSKRLICAEYVGLMLEMRNLYKILTGNPPLKRPLERPKRR